MRMRILQSYINDLSEQNEVLVQTIEELEKEANSRVAHLEGKLVHSQEIIKVRCVCVCVCEREREGDFQ